jgi:hypothetical protein
MFSFDVVFFWVLCGNYEASDTEDSTSLADQEATQVCAVVDFLLLYPLVF